MDGDDHRQSRALAHADRYPLMVEHLTRPRRRSRRRAPAHLARSPARIRAGSNFTNFVNFLKIAGSGNRPEGSSLRTAADPPCHTNPGGLAVLHRKAKRLARRWWVPAALACALGGGLLAQSALAAAPTPESNTSCGGTVSRAKPTSLDPNLLNYQLQLRLGRHRLHDHRRSASRMTTRRSTITRAASLCSIRRQPRLETRPRLLRHDPGRRDELQRGCRGVHGCSEPSEGLLDTTDPYAPTSRRDRRRARSLSPGAVVEIVVTRHDRCRGRSVPAVPRWQVPKPREGGREDAVQPERLEQEEVGAERAGDSAGSQPAPAAGRLRAAAGRVTCRRRSLPVAAGPFVAGGLLPALSVCCLRCRSVACAVGLLPALSVSCLRRGPVTCRRG